MIEMRRFTTRGWLVFFVAALSLAACGAPAEPTTLPPTAAVAPGSVPTSQKPPSPPLEDANPHCYTEANDPTTGQGLTEADCSEATKLAMNDLRVRQLLDGISYHWKSVVLWTRDQGGLIGAAVTLELPEPASVDGEWLGMVNDCTPGVTPPYHSIAYRQAVRDLRQVTAWVDLTAQQVVGVEPGPDPRYEGSRIGTPELVDPEATWPPGCPHQD